MSSYASVDEFCALIEDLGWDTQRCVRSLNASPEDIEAWQRGQRRVPDRILRILRKFHDITTGNSSRRPAHDFKRSTTGTWHSHVDNPHDNWHGGPQTNAQDSHTPPPPDVQEVEQLKGRVHELEDKLFRLRKSYRQLSSENERLRARLRDHRKERGLGETTSTAFGPYDILGVRPGDDWATIKAAYRALSRKHHPDQGGDVRKMQIITEAFTELKLIYD